MAVFVHRVFLMAAPLSISLQGALSYRVPCPTGCLVLQGALSYRVPCPTGCLANSFLDGAKPCDVTKTGELASFPR